MRRTPSSIMSLGLLLCLFTGAVQAQSLKIGYINSQEILANAPGASEAEAKFNEDFQGYQAEMQRLQEELTSMQERLEQQQLTLSPEAKTNREQAIRLKAQEYSSGPRSSTKLRPVVGPSWCSR